MGHKYMYFKWLPQKQLFLRILHENNKASTSNEVISVLLGLADRNKELEKLKKLKNALDTLYHNQIISEDGKWNWKFIKMWIKL